MRAAWPGKSFFTCLPAQARNICYGRNSKEFRMSKVEVVQFPKIEVLKGDLVLEITGNNGYVGRLYLSKGSIDFLPKDKSYDTLSLPWDKCARLMEKLDKKRRRKRKKNEKEKK